jgi:lysophospholipase L1-like esterase
MIRWVGLSICSLLLASCAGSTSLEVITLPAESIAMVQPKKAPVMVIIGDSQTSGTRFGGEGRANWVKLISTRLTSAGHLVDLRVSGQGGSGYSNVGTSGTTFVSEATRLVNGDTDAVVFFGSNNDSSAGSDLTAAVYAALDSVRRVAPKARILVVGPAWPRSEPYSVEVLSISEILRDCAMSAGVAFIDPLAENWFTDTPGVVGADGVHPTDLGHRIIADRLYPSIASLT